MRKYYKSLFRLVLILTLILSVFTSTLQPSYASAAKNTKSQTNFVDTISKGGYMITKKDTTIKTDRFIISLPKGIYVPKSLTKDINSIMDLIETFTTMKFYPANSKLDKVKIEVVKVNDKESEYGSAYGASDGVTISPGDLLINDKGNQFALTHELVHCIQFRNYGSLGQICDEGYATYMTEQILQNSPYPYLMDSHCNYGYMNQTITKANITQLFETDNIGWDGYLIGFRFMHYLEEELGSGTYLKILKAVYPKMTNDVIPLTQVNKAIKRITSNDIFTKFVVWYADHEDKFIDEIFTLDFTKSKRINLYPSFAKWNFYQILTFTYNKWYTIDFTSGFEYIQTYKKYNVNGFLGTIGSSGEATFKFYDKDGTLLLTKKLTEENIPIEVLKAVKIVITGDGKEVNVSPDFEKMVIKMKP